MSDALTEELIERWRSDPAATYQGWFLWDERLKNFRSIRRGVSQVVAEIDAGTFGVAYRGSALEIVVRFRLDPLEEPAAWCITMSLTVPRWISARRCVL